MLMIAMVLFFFLLCVVSLAAVLPSGHGAYQEIKAMRKEAKWRGKLPRLFGSNRIRVPTTNDLRFDSHLRLSRLPGLSDDVRLRHEPLGSLSG